MKKPIAIIVALLAAVLIGFFAFGQQKPAEPEIEFRYAPIAKGNLIRSISATGQVVADTTVDVKSKAGGKVVKLVVEEGSVVKAGDLIALIDPADTQSVYEQAQADLDSANARVEQARKNFDLQVAQNVTAVAEARSNLASAKVRLERAKLEMIRQPKLTRSAVETAKASLATAKTALDRLQKVEIPQQRNDAEANLRSAKVALDNANAELKRQIKLEELGYVASSSVERARTAVASAQNSYDVAEQRTKTLKESFEAQLSAAQLDLNRANSNYALAQANSAQDGITRADMAEATQDVKTAEINLKQAEDGRIQAEVRRNEFVSAQASTKRNQVAVQNAKVQLDSTTVVAPRDGVVTKKYLEEGTIIPPGTSTFAQGTSLVQISDVTQLYVECAVDEADIASVRDGQKVRIVTEAFPGEFLDGEVTRVNPAADTANNITAIKVRVRVKPQEKVKITPGMNATCEFITLDKPEVLIAPAQAVKTTGPGKATVRVKAGDKLPPTEKAIEIGETGNDGVEVISGLKEGEEVVTAEINVAELRDTQKKMQEAQQGGGLAGGGPQGGRRPSGTGGGGGGRPR
jgi:HlyD family secretion protein